MPYSIPIVGGRTYLEWLIYSAVCIGFIIASLVDHFNSIPTSDIDQGGTLSGGGASALGAIAVLFSLRAININTILFGISFERSIFWHKLLAVLAIVIAAIHGSIFISFSDTAKNGRELSGNIIFVLMIFTACSYVLKQILFEYFYFFHVAVYAAIIIISFIHGATFYGLAGIVWAVDLLFRYYLQRHVVQAQFEILPADIIKLKFPKPEGFKYNSLQYIFVCVPEVSYCQYHPFSVSSAPYENEVAIIYGFRFCLISLLYCYVCLHRCQFISESWVIGRKN